MKRIYILVLTLISLIHLGSKAQDLENYNLYAQNPGLYNPAFTVNPYFIKAHINSRLQWVGLDGAPRNYSFGVNMNFTPKMGVGVSAVKYSQGLTNNIKVTAAYGYQVNFSRKSVLKMGLKLGINNLGLSTSEAAFVDMSDEKLSQAYYNSTTLTTGFGFAYKYKYFTAQIIMPQIYELKALNLYSIAILAYHQKINRNWSFKPSIMVRKPEYSTMQYDINMAALWQNKLRVQLSFRSNRSLIFSLGLEAENYIIGYGYQVNSKPIGTGTAGSHELQIVYKFKRNSHRKLCPSYM
ncbi:MAG: PorP/SprF family type IX secretion system membrane protein [Bacteroidota bacterium]|nr:PorP/SprF family type IX secretion system membrane protein [Bacteroidota bacterium]